MAVSSPGRNVQLTLLTATCPPKRMVRSRVSRVVMANPWATATRLLISPLPACGESVGGLRPPSLEWNADASHRLCAKRSGEGGYRYEQRDRRAARAPHPDPLPAKCGARRSESPLVAD